jgi:hypothetical protein
MTIPKRRILSVTEIRYGFTVRWVVEYDGYSETTFYYHPDFAPFLADGGAA